LPGAFGAAALVGCARMPALQRACGSFGNERQNPPGAVELVGHRHVPHKTVNHSAEVYVDGDVTTNGIESAFSLPKRGIIGSWHRVSAKHLAAYLEEMQFRINRRNSKTLSLDTMRHVVTADPLTFERLTA